MNVESRRLNCIILTARGCSVVLSTRLGRGKGLIWAVWNFPGEYRMSSGAGGGAFGQGGEKPVFGNYEKPAFEKFGGFGKRELLGRTWVPFGIMTSGRCA